MMIKVRCLDFEKKSKEKVKDLEVDIKEWREKYQGIEVELKDLKKWCWSTSMTSRKV